MDVFLGSGLLLSECHHSNNCLLFLDSHAAPVSLVWLIQYNSEARLRRPSSCIPPRWKTRARESVSGSVVRIATRPSHSNAFDTRSHQEDGYHRHALPTCRRRRQCPLELPVLLLLPFDAGSDYLRRFVRNHNCLALGPDVHDTNVVHDPLRHWWNL